MVVVRPAAPVQHDPSDSSFPCAEHIGLIRVAYMDTRAGSLPARFSASRKISGDGFFVPASAEARIKSK